MPIITITTDFGNKDGFVGTMRGVIWSICPDAQIADITHEIPPQDILSGAIALARAVPFFPADTVHIAVVDPGVGTRRRPIACRISNQYFVGPDNGLFTPMMDTAANAGDEPTLLHLDRPEYWLPEISHTFHGRDIFSPVGAHLAAGVPFLKLGTPFRDAVRLSMPRPEPIESGWRAHVTVIDVFGNLTTDLPASALGGRREIRARIKGHEIHGLADSYGHRETGELISLIDSEGFFEIAVVNGNAAKSLSAVIGDTCEVVVP